MLKKIIISIAIIALAVMFFKFMIGSKEKAPEISAKEHVWRVQQSMVEKRTLSPVLTLYGRVESSELVNAAAPIASQVAKVMVKEGETIKQGQLLLSLDKGDFEPLLKSAQAKVNELNALLKSEQLRHKINVTSLKNEKQLLALSKKALARSEKVKRQKLGSISETELAMKQVEMQRLSYHKSDFLVQEHEARQEQLEARLIQAQADLAKARLALERSQIIAPFDGVIAKVNIAAGDRVNMNEKLLTFYSIERLEIRAKIPSNRLPEIQQSISEGEHLSAVVVQSTGQIPLLLERISGEAQASGVDAIFVIKGNNTRLRIGAIVVLRLQRSAQENMITVPYQSMYGSKRLYQIKENRLELIQVKTIGEYFPDDTSSNDTSPNDTLPDEAQDVQLLIASDELNNGDMILSTHLPNAFTGLKVETTQ